MDPNPYLLAADNSPELLPLLRDRRELAAQQDEHGYSLVHAAASYNHLDLLRALVRELGVPVDLRDEDGETALFVVETVEAARCLVEELALPTTLRNDEGQTAAAKLAAEAEFPDVAQYLAGLEMAMDMANDVLVDGPLPPPPAGMTVTLGAMPDLADADAATAASAADNADNADNTDNGEGSAAQALGAADPEFRRRIEELAARPDFHTEQGQAMLRQLVEDALSG